MNLWHGLTEATRRGYNSARNSFEFFCKNRLLVPFPVQSQTLIEWVSLRASLNGEYLQGRVSADTLTAYCAALRSVHVDRGLSTGVFEDETFKRVMAGIRRRQPPVPTDQAAPITVDILHKLVEPLPGSTPTPPQRVDDLNIVAAVCTAFGGFLRSGEITYDPKELHNQRTFEETRLLRSDVTFSETDDHVTIRLKRSKTDLLHKGVVIVIAATNSPICAVAALRRLFRDDPQPLTAPLFRFARKAFSYTNFVATLRHRLAVRGVRNVNTFSGHSLRRGATTTAKLRGMLDSDIQRLGRWSSEAFQRYIETDISFRFRLSKQLLTGAFPPFQY